MTSYNITFDAPTFVVSTNSPIVFGFEISQNGRSFRGNNAMAYEIPVSGGPSELKIVPFGAPPRNNRLDVANYAFPTPIWTGFDTSLVSVQLASNNLTVILTPLEATGSFTVTASVDGYSPATIDITIVAEPIDHFVIEASPVS